MGLCWVVYVIAWGYMMFSLILIGIGTLVMYRRANLPHFMNETNNRLEGFFGKLKETDKLLSAITMKRCLRCLDLLPISWILKWMANMLEI
ncbi:hypothetical protein PHMEG_00028947 [Phytophthora megakarya]|uniref:Uncharacterized protein n=1 Tax=Phytophthora megakarya TaxID=4795 RepID=A0A225V256_9STRA|nr:hypothetical protein PHMEG_00028947 [Phytophthora megakarya]